MLLVCSWCWMVGVAVSWPRGCCTPFRFPLLGWCLFCLPTRLRHGGSPGLCAAAPLAAGWLAPPGASVFFLLAGLLPCVGRLPAYVQYSQNFRGFSGQRLGWGLGVSLWLSSAVSPGQCVLAVLCFSPRFPLRSVVPVPICGATMSSRCVLRRDGAAFTVLLCHPCTCLSLWDPCNYHHHHRCFLAVSMQGVCLLSGGAQRRRERRRHGRVEAGLLVQRVAGPFDVPHLGVRVTARPFCVRRSGGAGGGGRRGGTAGGTVVD